MANVLLGGVLVLLAGCPKASPGGAMGTSTTGGEGNTRPAGGNGSRGELQKDLDKAQAELREACGNTAKITMAWDAFDAQATDAACDNNAHPSISQICASAATAIAQQCLGAKAGAGLPKQRGPILEAFGSMTELACTLDKDHEDSIRAWMASHAEWVAKKSKGLTKPECYRDGDSEYAQEVFKDREGGKRYGIFTRTGTTVTFSYTHEAAAPELYLDVGKM